jgi:hypothetical protein
VARVQSDPRAVTILSSARGEKLFEHCGCFFGQDAVGDRDVMIELRMIEHREARSHGATFGVWRAIDQPCDAGLNHGAGAHGAWLNRHIQFGAREAIVPEPLRSFAERNHFGVRGGIAIGDGAVAGARDDLIVNYYYGADWNFATLGCSAGFVQRSAHEAGVMVNGNGIVIARAHFSQDNMEPSRLFTRTYRLVSPYRCFSLITCHCPSPHVY